MIIFNRLILTILVCLTAQQISGQTVQNPSTGSILDAAKLKAKVYEDRFKDLISKEMKTFEDFKANGESKRKTIIESNFFVFQSVSDPEIISEFRNVTRRNDKLVSDREKTPAEFLERVRRAGSPEKELEKIQKESSRFDTTFEIHGLTLWQAPVLAPNLRKAFDFVLLGIEMIEGRSVYVVEYLQKSSDSSILINEKGDASADLTMSFNIPIPAKRSEIRLNGKLWIDTGTFEIRREERNLAVRSDLTQPVLKIELTYQPSEFGILTPQSIIVTQFRKRSKNVLQGAIQSKVRFDYSDFVKASVDVKILEESDTPDN